MFVLLEKTLKIGKAFFLFFSIKTINGEGFRSGYRSDIDVDPLALAKLYKVFRLLPVIFLNSEVYIDIEFMTHWSLV